MTIHVDADNFTRAETDRMFSDIARGAGGIGVFRHSREPASIDEQTVIRMNRDTLYSFAIVDLSEGASVTLPDAGARYLSVMIVDNDHHVTAIHHGAGTYPIERSAAESDYVLVAARTLVDPTDPDDIAAVGALQDQLRIDAGAARPFAMPDYDVASMDATRTALLSLAAGLTDFSAMFGTADEVNPVHHLIGTAAGWGGLPTSEAAYVGVTPGLDPGEYTLTMRDVPAEAFWSVSVYNAKGFFEPNPAGRYTVNSVTGVPNDDGSVTVRFTADPAASAPNTVPVPEGWNFLVRLYRPTAAFFDGSWSVPEVSPAG